MKLTDKEAQILACVEMQADLSIEEIQDETGFHEHTIRYHLHSLEERGIIHRRPFINMAVAGYTDVGIYLSPSLGRGLSQADLMGYLSELKDVIWLAELSGDYEIGLAFSVQQIATVEDHLQKLSLHFPNLFYEKVLAAQFRALRFPRRYLHRARAKSAATPLSLGQAQKVMALDEIDRSVLSALVHRDYRSRRELARLIEMPLSTLDDRVHKLEKSQLIAGYVYDVSAAAFGMQSYILLVFTKGLSQKLTQSLHDFAAEEPSVTFLYSCLGSWDFELNIEVHDYSEVRAVVEALHRKLGNYVNTVKVVTRHKEIKYTFVPF
jgi:DNA-binding Lrp family transcriptional regulator